MAQRVAEYVMRTRRFGPKVLLRVDLHGVSTFGPRSDQRTLIRWEWVDTIGIEEGCVVVRSAKDQVLFPPGAFGFAPDVLASRLEEARSITHRPDIIGELASR